MCFSCFSNYCLGNDVNNSCCHYKNVGYVWNTYSEDHTLTRYTLILDPILVLFTIGYHFGEKGKMQYYHSRSKRSVFTDLEDCEETEDPMAYYEVFPPDRFIIRTKVDFSPVVLCSSNEHVRRAGDKRVGVSRSTPASVSMQTRERIAPVLHASKFLIIYTTPVVH